MMTVVGGASSMEGARRTRRLRPFYGFCCPPAPPSKSGRRDAGARDTICLAVFSAPITCPELQILKNAPALSQNRPNVLLRNGEQPWFYRRQKSCDAACWRLSLVLSRSAG